MSSIIESLPEDILIVFTFYLSPEDLNSMRTTSSVLGLTATNDVPWQQLALTRWRSRHLETIRPSLEQWIAEKRSWREIFHRVEKDAKRTSITSDEICRLQWAFSDGRQTCNFSKCDSGRCTLRMQSYPEMPWRLEENGTVVLISSFPPHFVERLDSWGWAIKNQ
eukprot:g5756.t1